MGLSIIKPDINIDFVGLRKISLCLSGVVLLVGLLSLFIKGGPSYGIDFAGGVVVQVQFDRSVEPATIKSSLEDLNLPGLSVQRFGDSADNEYLVRVSQAGENPEDLRSDIAQAFTGKLPGASYEIKRLEMVGPKVGADLRSKAVEALYFAVLLIAIYISGRFEQRWFTAGIMAAALATGMYLLGQLGISKAGLVFAALLLTLALCWKLKLNFALGALVALIHDVTITVGLFSLLDKEFDLTIVAALLTIIGYSLNDTIIVYDRIREYRLSHQNESLGSVINLAINQTLSRTILTSGTTLLVIITLYFLGGGVIHDFALAMLIGVGVGTYSSIFVASPILLMLGVDVPAEEPAQDTP
ncbi:protein translocase subunit SecF [Oleidesulfovibrio alaskensis]|jgi:preprotein translocase subunit SecF|uniref:protein translocase subunit SecF n=1 Tax=Oleidesulfovibrio alaskensis TaxID=58180 RepID=UPI001A6086A8|nr:protein translocase subunit SecF [Oleidesulfovibrio alaskensis]MBL3581629.1 protein translocase subunit SecF [Oleidesulfovibrio alaskensis]MBL3588108.1 protein translocase subunit SecF [bacterium]